MFKTNILTFLFLLSSLIAFSQSDHIDKLNKKLGKSKEKNKSEIYNQLAYEWLTYNHDTAYKYANKALKLAQKYNLNKEEAMAFFNLGYYYELTEDLLHALESYNKSFIIYQQLGDKSGMASLASYIGTIYKYTGDYDLASKYFHLSLNLYMEIKDPEGITYALNNLGILYFKTGTNEKAEDAFAKSLKYARILHDTLSLSSTYNNLGLLAMKMGNYDSALKFFTQALELSKAIKDEAGIASIYSNIADVHLIKGEYDAALNYLSLVEINNSAEFNSTRTANNYLNRAQIYDKTNKPILAEEYYNKALDYALEKNLKPQLEDIYINYADFLTRNKRHAEANKYLFRLAEIKDSLYQKEITTQIANANIRLTLAEKKLNNTKIEKEKELSEMKLRTWKTSGIISLISFIIILFLLILINSRMINLKKQKKALEEKNAEIEGLNIKLSELHDKLSQNITHRTMQLNSEIEKRYKAEKNLQMIHTELKNLQELKNQYIVNLNGEIRSSLNIIIGFAKLLENTENKENRSYASYIINNAEHLYMTLQNMLAFEINEKQQISLNKSNFNLIDFHQQSIGYLMKLIPNLQIKEANGYTIPNKNIVSDRDLLQKLVIDSVKFLHNISKDSIVYVDGKSEEEYFKIVFSCALGIDSMSTIDKLLKQEGFVDLKTLSKDDAYIYSSLFFIRSFITALECKINLILENQELKIEYNLPFYKEDETTNSIPVQKTDFKFAIVEGEDKISALLLQKKLESKGTCSILQGITISDTKKLQEATDADIIFLDIPSEDIQEWAQIAKKLKLKEMLPPVVAVSAYLTQEDIDILLNSGFSFYLNKPLKTEYLYNIINRLSSTAN